MKRVALHVPRLQVHVLLVCLGCLLAACSFAGQPPASPPPLPTAILTTPAPPATSIPESIPAVDDTGAEVATVAPGAELVETYRNELAGYSFDYPAGWLVDGEGEYVSLQNYRSEDLPPREVNDPALYKIEFVWIRPGQASTVKEMLSSMSDGLDSIPTDVTVNGLTGVRFKVRGFRGEVADTLLLDLNGRVLLVQSWQHGRLFDRVTATLRPLDASNSPDPSTGLSTRETQDR